MHARAQADADIHAVGGEVRIGGAGRDARVDVGMPGKKAIDPRHQPLGRQPRRGAHHQDAVLLGAIELLHGRAQALEAGADARIDQARRLGQLDGARAAHGTA